MDDTSHAEQINAAGSRILAVSRDLTRLAQAANTLGNRSLAKQLSRAAAELRMQVDVIQTAYQANLDETLVAARGIAGGLLAATLAGSLRPAPRIDTSSAVPVPRDPGR